MTLPARNGEEEEEQAMSSKQYTQVSPYDVELQNVSKAFGASVAVRELSLSVERGIFFSLLGPSGCGKTTTLRLIAGFEQPTSGHIMIRGTDVAGLPPYRRDVNTVFQSYALFPHMSVANNIAYGLRQRHVGRSEIRRRVAEVLDMVRLAGWEERRPAQLSGGQQQRVALARALINRPTVLLLDEPLSALDLKLRRGMQNELKEMQHAVGITFVYVTHDQEEAITLSNRIAVLNAGQLEQEGIPAEIYERPQTRFVADFIGLTNFIDGTVREIDGGNILVETPIGRVIASGTQPGVGCGEQVTLTLRPEKLQIRSSRPDTEDAPPTGETTGWNAVQGLISQATFLGAQIEYRVHIGDPGGQEITIRQQNIGTVTGGAVQSGEWRAFGPGEQVTLTWRWEASLILRRTPEHSTTESGTGTRRPPYASKV
jgi:spermidine/putrescine transport system ATP-binding protein